MTDEANNYHIDYNKLVNNAALILQAKEDAFYAKDLLGIKEQEIAEFEQISGFNATPAWDIYNKAATELENERYSNARDLLTQVTPTLDQIQVDATRLTTKLLAQKNRFFEWIMNNLLSILSALLVIVLFVIVFYKQLQIILLQKKINGLLIETEVLQQLMKKAQKEYYTDGKITKSMYAMKTEMYKTRQEEIKSLLPVLKKEVEKRQQQRLEKILK